jgi:spoIIIJ-associated protein
MEWVETTAKTVEEAKELALDRLGVDEIDAEFEVLEAPRPGLFGRVKGEARVRARVRPTRPRPKTERRDRKQHQNRAAATSTQKAQVSSVTEAESTIPDGRNDDVEARPTSGRNKAASAGRATPSVDDVAAEAVRFTSGLLDALGLDGTTEVQRDGNELEVVVSGPNLGMLIGPRGATLLAVQDLVRVASQRRLGDHDTRLRVDVNGYREKRRAALARFAIQQADEVVASGQARILEPMPSADRKVVHDALIGRADVVTRSEGEDPTRRVVIAPVASPND